MGQWFADELHFFAGKMQKMPGKLIYKPGSGTYKMSVGPKYLKRPLWLPQNLLFIFAPKQRVYE